MTLRISSRISHLRVASNCDEQRPGSAYALSYSLTHSRTHTQTQVETHHTCFASASISRCFEWRQNETFHLHLPRQSGCRLRRTTLHLPRSQVRESSFTTTRRRATPQLLQRSAVPPLQTFGRSRREINGVFQSLLSG